MLVNFFLLFLVTWPHDWALLVIRCWPSFLLSLTRAAALMDRGINQQFMNYSCTFVLVLLMKEAWARQLAMNACLTFLSHSSYLSVFLSVSVFSSICPCLANLSVCLSCICFLCLCRQGESRGVLAGRKKIRRPARSVYPAGCFLY